MYSINFYVPESHLESVKTALFAAGAGDYGNYDCCCWQTLGTGQYRPLADSKPYLGKENEITHANEYKVEIICQQQNLKKVIDALIASHPYEVPAYSIHKIIDLRSLDAPP